MSAIIKPMRDKKTGKVLTNYEICKRMKATLDNFKNPPQHLSKKEREELQLEYDRICGGAQNADNLSKWLDQVTSVDEEQGQKIIEKTLIPVR